MVFLEPSCREAAPGEEAPGLEGRKDSEGRV